MDSTVRTDRRQTRRRFVQACLSMSGFALLSGCGVLPSPWATGPAGGRESLPVPRIGVLASGSPEADVLDVFQEGLQSLGRDEGKTLDIEWRFAEGDPDRLDESAAELVALGVAVIVVDSGAIAAARRATQTIPIVMAFSVDPIELGYVASLDRPGGNVTGSAFLASEAAPKGLGLLKAAVPGISRVAILWHGGSRMMGPQFRETERAAQGLGLQVSSLDTRDPDDLDDAFAAATAGHADALITLLGPLTTFHRLRILDLAARHRLPALHPHRDFAADGGLMAYGPRFATLYRRAATYVDKILKGAEPAELPIEQPTTFDFVINLKTAHALGLTIPQSVLLQATEVIQ
jgi:putative ABC transport system substrate-binding protein